MRSLICLGLLGLLVGCDGGGALDAGSVDAASLDAGDTAGSDAGPATPLAPRIPAATGACPDLSQPGTVELRPDGIAPRQVELYVSDAAATLDGPVVFYWHGTGSQPREVEVGLGTDAIDAVLALGGLVVAPHRDPNAGTFPWYLTAGAQDDDLRVADELLGCAAAGVGLDPDRVHSIGFSAGALHTTQMAYRRASYIASVVTYSGGLVATRPRTDARDNHFAGLLFHGGPTDIVVINFQTASESLFAQMDGDGHFAAICNHGAGHRIPPAQASVWQFFQDHPYGQEPSPYEAGLPAGFPEYCGLTP